MMTFDGKQTVMMTTFILFRLIKQKKNIMKRLFKTIILATLIFTGILYSCKKQDGYSDQVNTIQDQRDSTSTLKDSLSGSNGVPANSSSSGGSNKDVPNSGAESTNAASNTGTTTTGGTATGNGKAGSTNTVNAEPENNETKGTGTGTGPGPSAKDGSAYSGPSDPQNSKIETKKNKAGKSQNK